MKNRKNLFFFIITLLPDLFASNRAKEKSTSPSIPKPKSSPSKSFQSIFPCSVSNFSLPFQNGDSPYFCRKKWDTREMKKGRNMCNAAYRSFTHDLFTNPMLSRVKYRTSYRFLLSWLYRRDKYSWPYSHIFSFLVEKI